MRKLIKMLVTAVSICAMSAPAANDIWAVEPVPAILMVEDKPVEVEYFEYSVPANKGFKSYMSYKAITSKSSPQYKLQHNQAYTGDYGIRQVDGRYCIAVGSYFTEEIGKYLDLVLENGVVIPCILSDQKADKDTDSTNRVTKHNGCVSEFVVDASSLVHDAKVMGDVSYANPEWRSPVVSIRVYNN